MLTLDFVWQQNTWPRCSMRTSCRPRPALSVFHETAIAELKQQFATAYEKGTQVIHQQASDLIDAKENQLIAFNAMYNDQTQKITSTASADEKLKLRISQMEEPSSRETVRP